jgi:hypothetical protein
MPYLAPMLDGSRYLQELGRRRDQNGANVSCSNSKPVFCVAMQLYTTIPNSRVSRAVYWSPDGGASAALEPTASVAPIRRQRHRMVGNSRLVDLDGSMVARGRRAMDVSSFVHRRAAEFRHVAIVDPGRLNSLDVFLNRKRGVPDGSESEDIGEDEYDDDDHGEWTVQNARARHDEKRRAAKWTGNKRFACSGSFSIPQNPCDNAGSYMPVRVWTRDVYELAISFANQETLSQCFEANIDVTCVLPGCFTSEGAGGDAAGTAAVPCYTRTSSARFDIWSEDCTGRRGNRSGGLGRGCKPDANFCECHVHQTR